MHAFGPTGVGNFDIILDQIFYAPYANSLLGAHANRASIGAWNLMVWPIWGFRQRVPAAAAAARGYPVDGTQ